MKRTIIGVFDSHDSAIRAREDLMSLGFSATAVRLQAGDTSDATPNDLSVGSTTGTHHHEGGVRGFFKSLFGMDDDEQVGVYSEAVRRGHYLLTVDVDNDTELTRAEEILQRYGTVDLDERSTQWRQEGWTGGAMTAGVGAATGTTAADRSAADTTRAGLTTDTTGKIPVVQEELQVDKRAVQRGGVRVFTRVVETPVQESVNLREEHATVQRRAVDRPATEADFAAMQGGTIEVRETVEEPVVAKSARVVEEIEVGKQVTEQTQTVRDTVRRTDVQVEQLEGEHAMARSGTTDTTRTTGVAGAADTTRTGSADVRDAGRPSMTDRAGDAVERAIPGDSDRDGK